MPRARSVRRSPGRPPAGDEAPREALLDAARGCFARHGYAGASLRRIAVEAGVTPTLAAYHFGDKAGLLQAVIEERVAPLAQALLTRLDPARPDPLPALREFVLAYTLTAARHPWLPQLIVREVLSEEGVLRESFVRRFGQGLATRLRGTVQAAQDQGRLRRDLDAAHVAMSLVSLCIFPFLATPLVRGALGIATDAAHADALAAHHWSLFVQGVSP